MFGESAEALQAVLYIEQAQQGHVLSVAFVSATLGAYSSDYKGLYLDNETPLQIRKH